MIIALWICATMASLGIGALLLALFSPIGTSPADDRMTAAFFMAIGAVLLGGAAIMFILLTAIKAWS